MYGYVPGHEPKHFVCVHCGHKNYGNNGCTNCGYSVHIPCGGTMKPYNVHRHGYDTVFMDYKCEKCKQVFPDQGVNQLSEFDIQRIISLNEDSMLPILCNTKRYDESGFLIVSEQYY